MYILQISELGMDERKSPREGTTLQAQNILETLNVTPLLLGLLLQTRCCLCISYSDSILSQLSKLFTASAAGGQFLLLLGTSLREPAFALAFQRAD